LWIDLLKEDDEERFGRAPDTLSHVLAQTRYERVVLDEVQKAPKLLDVVHREMEQHRSTVFILTGSSARKLKRGHADLLAGRALSYHLHPFTSWELGQDFDLPLALQFGSLPGLPLDEDDDMKREFLRSYTRTYLHEEIRVEQLVRKLNPFRNFLEVAAQCNGMVLNYAKLSRDLGVDDKTVQNYFSVLEDTLVGLHLPACHRSVRKQQRQAPKFYLFDTGVKRALERNLRLALQPRTHEFGRAFEHWVILECHRLNDYLRCDYRFSYLRTRDNAEVDLVVERPGRPDLLIEIKSTAKPETENNGRLARFQRDWDRPCEAQLWSLRSDALRIGTLTHLPWQQGLAQLFRDGG